MAPAIVEWNRGPLAPLAGRPLEDERVQAEVADVRKVMDIARKAQAGSVSLGVEELKD